MTAPLAGPELAVDAVRRSAEAVSTGTAMGPEFLTASGCWLTDAAGERYFDGTAGSGAVTLGHQYPAIVRAATDQMTRLVHTGCKLTSSPRRTMVDRLAQLSPYPDAAVLPTVTGSEAVESALKIARAATGRRITIGFQHAFHGKTAGALELTWRASFKTFSGRFGGDTLVARLPAGEAEEPSCLDELESLLTQAACEGGAAAVVLEPVQVTEGVRPVRPAFLDLVADIVGHAGALLVLDEIYTGLGRAGTLFYADRLRRPPDLLLVGKSLGNGFPIAAVVGRRSVVNRLPAGVQTSTFSGHPVSCAAAVAVLDAVTELDVAARAREVGTVLADTLDALTRRYRWISGFRQVGALAAVDCGEDGRPAPTRARAFAAAAERERLLLFTGGPDDSSVKIVPPVLMTTSDLDFLVTALRRSADRVEAGDVDAVPGASFSHDPGAQR